MTQASKPQNESNQRYVMPLLAVMLLLTACAIRPSLPPVPLPPAPVQSAQIPPLPQWVTQDHRPTWCQPGCTIGLTNSDESLLKQLTERTQPSKSAPGSTR